MTPLLTNDLLSRVEQLRINPQHRRSNRGRGEHISRKGGSSNEFADYRDYSEGDDVRFIDWNAYSRLRRPYLKLYRHEEEMHVVLLIDASSSMLYEGKLERAKQIAAAMGVMGLFGGERVSVYAFNQAGATPLFLKPCAGRGRMRQLFGFIEGIASRGSAPLDVGIEDMLKHHRGRGAAILLSDFLTFGDLRRACNLVFSAGLEIFGLQILSPPEIDPLINGDLRLVDCENPDAWLDILSRQATWHSDLPGVPPGLSGAVAQLLHPARRTVHDRQFRRRPARHRARHVSAQRMGEMKRMSSVQCPVSSVEEYRRWFSSSTLDPGHWTLDSFPRVST